MSVAVNKMLPLVCTCSAVGDASHKHSHRHGCIEGADKCTGIGRAKASTAAEKHKKTHYWSGRAQSTGQHTNCNCASLTIQV